VKSVKKKKKSVIEELYNFDYVKKRNLSLSVHPQAKLKLKKPKNTKKSTKSKSYKSLHPIFIRKRKMSKMMYEIEKNNKRLLK